MKRCLLRWHLGAGDALLCNGLVRSLVEDRGLNLLLPCWPHNEETVSQMFSDLIPAVETFAVDADGHYNYQDVDSVIRLGVYGLNFEREQFDRSFYDQVGVPFNFKWTRFKIGTLPPPAAFPERLIHDDPSRGFIIPLSGHRPERKRTLFNSFYNAVVTASEIHCINSSVAILVDLVRVNTPKFLHRYARPDGGAIPELAGNWTILDKPL